VPIKFIHAADLHIDSPLTGLDRYEGAPVEELRNSTRAAFQNLIGLAIEERVAFVLLAGDVFDGDWRDFRTGLFFVSELQKLNDADIPVFIVHGNHDSEGGMTKRLPLPDNVHVFSSRTAETRRLEDKGVAIHGRSFPERHVPEDLVPDYPAPIDGYFNIGILHTSLTGRPGHAEYAPTSEQTLTEKGYDYWALGHVHAREVVSESPRIVFPGNIQGWHARETGAKGCDLVTVKEDGTVINEPVELDVVRWHRTTLDLTGINDDVRLKEAVIGCLEALAIQGQDRLLAVRIILIGQSRLNEKEAQTPGVLSATVQAASFEVSAGQVWVEKVINQLSPIIDREHEARRDDAVGELVRLVDDIKSDPDMLKQFMNDQMKECLAVLPSDLRDLEVLLGERGLEGLLTDAEATILASLSAGGTRP